MSSTALVPAPSTALVPVGRDGLTARGMLDRSLEIGRAVIVRHRYRDREYRHAGKVTRVDRGMITLSGCEAPSRGHMGQCTAVTVRIPDIVTVAWRPGARPV